MIIRQLTDRTLTGYHLMHRHSGVCLLPLRFPLSYRAASTMTSPCRVISQYKTSAADTSLRENCGSIVWQWGEPWRNVSCTCMVDYDNKPKGAYYAFREAMKSEHVSLRYDKLIWKRGETFRGKLFVHSDSGTYNLSDESARILGAEGSVLAEVSDAFTWTINMAQRTFTVECTLAGKVVNRYLFFVTDEANPYADRKAVQGLFAN